MDEIHPLSHICTTRTLSPRIDAATRYFIVPIGLMLRSATLSPEEGMPTLHLCLHHRPRLLPLQLPLLDANRVLQQVQLLLHVARLQSRRDTSTRVPACVHHVLPIVVLRLVQ